MYVVLPDHRNAPNCPELGEAAARKLRAFPLQPHLSACLLLLLSNTSSSSTPAASAGLSRPLCCWRRALAELLKTMRRPGAA